jgi:hypothetical protein
VSDHRDRRFSVRAFLRGIKDSLRRSACRPEAPPVSKSLIYALCEEYRHSDLWAAYHAFRLDPRARNWRRLRGRNVPWQGEQTVERLFLRSFPWNGKRTPDPAAVGLALISAPSNSTASLKKKR